MSKTLKKALATAMNERYTNVLELFFLPVNPATTFSSSSISTGSLRSCPLALIVKPSLASRANILLFALSAITMVEDYWETEY